MNPHEDLKVSVIIPAYNSANTVAGTIASVLSQTLPAHEIIVVDDGSTDDTRTLLEAHGQRIIAVYQQNLGVSAARNAGARAATGDLLAFLDADDILLPPYLEQMLDRWQDAGSGRRAVASNAYFLRDEGLTIFPTVATARTPRGDRQRLAILQTNFLTNFLLMPRQVFDELGGYDESLRAVEDWDLWLRAILSGVEAVRQPRPLVLYRWRPGSLSNAGDLMGSSEQVMFDKTLERFADSLTPDETSYIRSRLELGSARLLRMEADAALAAGDYGLARRIYSLISAVAPRDLKLRVRSSSMKYFPPSARIWRRRLLRSTRSL